MSAIDFSQDAEQPGSDTSLRRVTELAQLFILARDRVAKLEADLETAKEDARLIEQEDLPELLREVGLLEVVLEDGSKVELKDDLSCGISEERRAVAHQWLRDKGLDGVIKTYVAVEYGRGELEQAEALARQITIEEERPAIVEERVHPMTLKALLKEQREKGVNVPVAPFALRPFSKAVLTAPTKPKRKKQ